MIRDRGNIKWTSMMLPEHVKLLREWAKEEEFQQRPELDEQELEILDEAIGMAMEENREVHITVHQNNRLTKYSGKIHYADALTHSIRLIDTEGKRQTIKIDSIIKIEE